KIVRGSPRRAIAEFWARAGSPGSQKEIRGTASLPPSFGPLGRALRCAGESLPVRGRRPGNPPHTPRATTALVPRCPAREPCVAGGAARLRAPAAIPPSPLPEERRDRPTSRRRSNSGANLSPSAEAPPQKPFVPRPDRPSKFLPFPHARREQRAAAS